MFHTPAARELRPVHINRTAFGPGSDMQSNAILPRSTLPPMFDLDNAAERLSRPDFNIAGKSPSVGRSLKGIECSRNSRRRRSR
jgi:hypothetical protein